MSSKLLLLLLLLLLDPAVDCSEMAMRARLGRLWNGGSRERDTSLESKEKSAPAARHSSIRLVVGVMIALFVLVFFMSNSTSFSWSEPGVDPQSLGKQSSKSQTVPTSNTQTSGEQPIRTRNTQTSEEQPIRTSNLQPSKAEPIPITLTCPNQIAPTCGKSSTLSSTLSLNTPQNSPTCPEYFRWIHEDLLPWKSAGITKELVESAQKLATFRLVVLDGRVYVEEYFGHSMTRNVFTLWGILQLINRYPGRVPDLDLMFNCVDQPSVRSSLYSPSTLPPVFHYCKDDQTSDILFPDWSFWGWPETNIKPWAPLLKEMKQVSEELKWADREPYAFWKGNPTMGANRQELLQCNATNEHDWNARIYSQDWSREERQGYQGSNLARQCNNRQVSSIFQRRNKALKLTILFGEYFDRRYRIYVDGLAWSVSMKYIMACNSPTLFVKTPWVEFFQRGLIPGHHYWPIPDKDKCRAIKFAVDWGNEHPKEAQAMGKASSEFFEEQVKMDHVYDYMLHVLTEYAKLLRYKPTIPEKATEICLESMACPAQENVKKFMLESMEKWTHVAEPCSLPPPFAPGELQQINDKRADSVVKAEMWQQNAWAEHGNNL
ncbi:O-glucosyltransferase rumi-like [Canna indica]|uniref:O-glucosyltransferase rumi-like n=1 Tax=Canna indica TaxID=4628 RepID=A0AAQ3QR04_9LILI|nr:O-glucosyltransferase rumi-like [Canna indica]